MQVRITPTVKALMIACFVAFIVQHTVDQFFGGNLLSWFALIPSEVVFHFRWWQLITHAFLHADVMHLILNLLMLAFIGGELEAAWGRARFIRFYFFCVIIPGLVYLLLQVVASGDSLRMPMVGASGAIYGLLMAYGLIFGERVLLFMMLFPMKAKHFIWVLAFVEFMSTLYSGGRPHLSSVAHLAGMAAGFAYLWGRAAWVVARNRQKERSARGQAESRKRRRLTSHLKLVINNERHEGGDHDDEDSDHPRTWH